MGRWNEFEAAVTRGQTSHLTIGEQKFSSAEVAPLTREVGAPGFTPIGIGKPLCVEVLTVYTGDIPGRRRNDLMVASGVKSIETFDAAPRAVNQLIDNSKVGDNRVLLPSAFNTGTPIVYYSPGVVNATTLIALELISDSFDDSVFSSIGGLFDAAAGIPIFAPAKSLLVVGSFLVKTFASLGKALFETDAFLQADVQLRFDTPGFPVSLARHVVLCNERDHNVLKAYKVQILTGMGEARAVLVHRQSGNEYSGSAPYLIANFNGAKRAELENFTPTLASAALLERFYKADDVGGKAMTALQEGLQLFNDLSFHKKAEQLKKNLDPADAAYEKMYNLLLGYNSNIQNPLMKFELPPKET